MVEEKKIPEGYKETEVGVIPIEWETHLLEDEIASLDAGVSVNSIEGTVMKNDYAILKTSAVYKGKFLPSESKKIRQNDIKRAKLNPTANSLIISRMNTPELVGECAYINSDYPKLFIPDRLWQTTLKRESTLNCQWLNYLLNTGKYRKTIKGLATGTSNSMKNISKQQLLSVRVPFPNESEQQDISTALSDIDDLILSLEKLINKKKLIKQGAMQELLTGKKRLDGFCGDWIEVKLREVCNKITTGKLDANAMRKDGKYRFYTCAREYYFINEYAFDDEALLVSGNGANVGYIHYYNGKFNAYQRTYVLTGFSENILFLKAYMEKYLKVRIDSEVNAGNTPYIKMDTITDMSIFIPQTSEEQTAIANIISDMDNEIEKLEVKLDKYKKIKKGMMEELLTGNRRLV